jgi:hypothetical protein
MVTEVSDRLERGYSNQHSDDREACLLTANQHRNQ